MIYNQFYSSNNKKSLEKIINDDLLKNHHLSNINTNLQIHKCMEYVKNNVSSIPPKNMNNNEYLNLMNKKVYSLVISYYKTNKKQFINQQNTQQNIIQQENKINSESAKVEDKLFDSEILKNYKNNSEVIDYPKSSSMDNSTINKHTEKLKEERELIYPQAKEVNFNLDNEEENNNTLDLYNGLLTTYNKQVNDLSSYEDNQKIINENVEDKFNILEENNNINKLTPITSLANIEDRDNINMNNNQNNKTDFEDSIKNFQQFLSTNNNEIKKENIVKESIIKENILENNGTIFSDNNVKKNILLKEPDYKTSLKTDYIVIDSRYRNFYIHPNQCDFVFNFSPADNNFIFKTYKEQDTVILREKKIVIGNNSQNDVGETFDNINTVYLDNVIVPVHSYEYNTEQNGNDLLSELSLTIYKDSYLLLEIPELRSPYKGGNTNFKKSFAVLRINHGSSLTSITFSNNFTNLIVPNEIMLYEPSSLGKLDKFTLKLNNKNGRMYNFGIDKLFIKNFQKGNLKNLGICGKKEYSTIFEVNRKHPEYIKICKQYYNTKDCDTINNNPLIIRDLIYFYHIVPNENELVFFEDNIKLDVFKKTANEIKLALSYKIENKKDIVNHLNLFRSFKIVNEDFSNYYFIVIIKGNKYYLKISNVTEEFIYLENYDNLPTFNKNSVKFGLSKGNKAGSNNESLESLFYTCGYNVITVDNTSDEDDKLGKYIIEIDYPYENLPTFIKENNFKDDDLFIIQDKKQISYGFTIKYNVKDYSNMTSYLNESGHN